jgi:hypothetical protein
VIRKKEGKSMHIPELGSYPLILRNYDVSNPRDGELLLNYETDDLYYINRSDSKRIRVADDIYRRILESKVQNNKIITYDYDYHKEDIDPVVDGVITLDDATVTGRTLTLKVDSASDTKVTGTTLTIDAGEFIVPPIAGREYNAFYYIITKRSIAESPYRSTTLHLDKTESYVINDIGEEDPEGHIVVLAPSDIVVGYSYGKLILNIEDYDE